MQKTALEIRAKVIQAIRHFFAVRGFLEVETPLLLPANAPEEHIDPVFASSWQLQTSPEICMKRLLCRGYKKIFQISRCWRAAERGNRHLPEFTMLEWYRADSDYLDLMNDCQELLREVAAFCTEDRLYSRYGLKIDPMADWERISVLDAFRNIADIDAIEAAANGTFDEVLVTAVEPGLSTATSPVILYDYPASMAALSRLKNDNPLLAERFELYLGGLELANGFSELNDPNEQLVRFKDANLVRLKNGNKELPIPLNFIAELDKMPPSAGIALGIDRLVMLATGASSIDQVVAFTPETL